MTRREQQEAEIQTIKERDIKLKLSDADVERLFIKAGECGLTASQLLENFIGDLVDGTYSNGSDERDYASQWFDRCWFSMGFGDFTFLQWLITNNCVDEAVDVWEIIQDFAEQDVLDDDETNDLACARSELADIFNEYRQTEQAIKDSTLQGEMPKVMQWWNDLRKMQAGNVNKKAVQTVLLDTDLPISYEAALLESGSAFIIRFIDSRGFFTFQSTPFPKATLDVNMELATAYVQKHANELDGWAAFQWAVSKQSWVAYQDENGNGYYNTLRQKNLKQENQNGK